ncbi:MAG: hypothetical protein DRP06_03545 [Candidatus Aenigmatarchaeota archaeon]|nr:MAG: hypothetical protein DRP06_03545 [Candidatus Aenigmarchaeota archaeon]
MVKDRIVSWFIKNILLPKIEIISQPSFLLISSKGILLRDIAFPEHIFVEIEKKIKRNILYRIGKCFGYNYALNTHFETIEGISENKFRENTYFLVRYIESISYGKKLIYTLDYKKKVFKMKMKDYIVCSKNGLGYIIAEGLTAGFYAYATCDNTMEGVQTKCQGRGDKNCELICAPSKVLKEKKIKFLKETDLENLEIDAEYMAINKIRPTQFARYSLKDLIDSGFFEYSKGAIHYKDERHFLCEASLMYILEKELKKLKGGGKVLFDVSFDYGKSLAEESKYELNNHATSGSAESFITNYMSALGWGDVLVIKKSGKYTVISNYFPWTKWAKDIKYLMFRGMISGLLSGFLNKKITLKKFQTDFSGGFLTVIADE